MHLCYVCIGPWVLPNCTNWCGSATWLWVAWYYQCSTEMLGRHLSATICLQLIPRSERSAVVKTHRKSFSTSTQAQLTARCSLSTNKRSQHGRTQLLIAGPAAPCRSPDAHAAVQRPRRPAPATGLGEEESEGAALQQRRDPRHEQRRRCAEPKMQALWVSSSVCLR